jgi:hypothetical protein
MHQSIYLSFPEGRLGMTTILAVACVTVTLPTVERVQLSTPEGRLQVLQHLGRKVDAGTLTYNEIKAFDVRLNDFKKRDNAVHKRVLALATIKDDTERRKAAEQLKKELDALQKERVEFRRVWEEIARRAEERRNKSK